MVYLIAFGKETISDDDFENYYKVGELRNETDRGSGSIFDRYSDSSDDETDSMNPE